jgi:hypothetical protein
MPKPVWYRPLPQLTQRAMPVPVWYLPAPHRTQLLPAMYSALISPAGQLLHVWLPTTFW